ncbi:MAG: hypothetical protein AB1768_18275 [Pseudomonadota bacterium]
MELRKQLKEIGPPVAGGEVIGEEAPKKKPTGKWVVGGILLLVVGAAGFGMMSKGNAPPDPGALGMAAASGHESAPTSHAPAPPAAPAGGAPLPPAAAPGADRPPASAEAPPVSAAQPAPASAPERAAGDAKTAPVPPSAPAPAAAAPTNASSLPQKDTGPRKEEATETKPSAVAHPDTRGLEAGAAKNKTEAPPTRPAPRPAARSAVERIGISEE